MTAIFFKCKMAILPTVDFVIFNVQCLPAQIGHIVILLFKTYRGVGPTCNIHMYHLISLLYGKYLNTLYERV